jgi:hypothetical protein
LARTDPWQILFKYGLIGARTCHNACRYWHRHMRYWRRMKACPLPLDDEWSDAEEFVKTGTIRLREFEPGGRDWAEVRERKRARDEGRPPVLPPAKYTFGRAAG